MIALDEYEATLCPACGNPIAWCHDPARERDTDVELSRCIITDMRERVVDAHTADPTVKRPGALTTRLTSKTNN